MNNLLLIELIGIPVIYLGGVAFHFLYKYGGKKKWMAIISPVNESIWEHLKLAFYPVLLFTLIQYLLLYSVPLNYLTAEFLGIYLMFGFILLTEWIYPKIMKRNIFIVDLLIFFFAVTISQLASYIIMTNHPEIQLSNLVVILLLVAQTIIFTIFSFKPPKLGIFRDSEDGLYGIK